MIQVTEKNKCCGCAACLQKCPQKCISFIEDEEGFLYPKINFNECIDCNICNNVCPIINQGEKKLPKKIYASKSKNEFIRLNSSSGGLFTLLAEKIIEEGGVVFGARFNNNWEVTHNYTEQKDNLHTFRGSKYLQSKINNNYLQAEEYLKSNRKVLFTGTPEIGRAHV